ncbi:phage minor tail protein [Striga asiatica]|uniref:Phage minor tail protein n=1 Tax=Striga asiatica TaxID=4170 RepID=A0A5A7P6P4_STRAF|nr:phage minor tail protein [Striga asiatica]
MGPLSEFLVVLAVGWGCPASRWLSMVAGSERCLGSLLGSGFSQQARVWVRSVSGGGDRWDSSAAAASGLDEDGGLWSPVFVWARFAVSFPNFSTMVAVGRVCDIRAGSG